MLSIAGPLKGQRQRKYYLALAKEDYYNSGHEEPGEWFGQGAESLGLSGQVHPDAFKNLYDGFSADGRRALVQNAGKVFPTADEKGQRQAGWDLTFSPPKCVSLLWSQAPAHIRSLILGAHRAAVKEVLRELEEEAAFSRVGKGGTQLVKAKLTFAIFQHYTSRALDPQVHSHAVLINVGVRPDLTTGTLLSQPLFDRKVDFGSRYRDRLAAKLEEQLHISIEKTEDGFHIAGVPHALCEQMSKRRKAILDKLNELGAHDAVTAKYAARITRQKKCHVPQDELFRQWLEVGAEYGWSTAQVLELLEKGKREKAAEPVRCAKKEVPTPSTANEKNFEPEDRIPKPLAASELARGSAGSRPNTGPQNQTHEGSEQKNSQRSQSDGFDRSTAATPSMPAETPKAKEPGKPWLHIEYVALFPNAPTFSPFCKLMAPRLVLGYETPAKRWGQVLWQKPTLVGNFTIQKKKLLPRALDWTPLRALAAPALVLWQNHNISPWRKKLWEKKTPFGTLSVEFKKLFPRALEWNPAGKLSLPAIRFQVGTKDSPRHDQAKESRGKTEEHGHSH